MFITIKIGEPFSNFYKNNIQLGMLKQISTCIDYLINIIFIYDFVKCGIH